MNVKCDSQWIGSDCTQGSYWSFGWMWIVNHYDLLVKITCI